MRIALLALAALGLIQAGGGAAFAQQADAVDDRAFDCPAFKAVIAAAPDGFGAFRGAVTRKAESITAYAVSSPLFGSCQIIDKAKVSEISYSCEAEKLGLADLKATLDSCLGETAQHYAANENPNTPMLRYNVPVAGKQARVIAMKTFAKVTLVVLNPK
jgi:hypothetical protein